MSHKAINRFIWFNSNKDNDKYIYKITQNSPRSMVFCYIKIDKSLGVGKF